MTTNDKRGRRKKVVLIALASVMGVAALGATIWKIRHSGSAWAVDQTEDAMTDVPSASMQSRSASGDVLEISCSGGRPMQLIIRSTVRLTGYDEKPQGRVLQFRFDERPVSETIGSIDGNFIVFPDTQGRSWVARILAGLPGSERLAMKFSEGAMMFPTAGAAEALDQVRETCGIH